MPRKIQWTEQLEDRIAGLLESKSLRTVCEQNPDLPDRITINRRLAASSAFASKCARARAEHAQSLLEDVQTEVLKAKTKEDAYVANVKAAHVQWYASKLIAKVYGDKQAIELSGSVDLAGKLAAARERAKKQG